MSPTILCGTLVQGGVSSSVSVHLRGYKGYSVFYLDVFVWFPMQNLLLQICGGRVAIVAFDLYTTCFM